MKMSDKKIWGISQQGWRGKYWKIYTHLEVSGRKQSAEGGNFIFPAIHQLRRHLLWAERHIANLLLIPPKNISGWFHFPKIKFNKGSVNCTQCKIDFMCTTRAWCTYSKCNKNYRNFQKIKSKQLSSSSLSEPSAISVHFPLGWSTV